MADAPVVRLCGWTRNTSAADADGAVSSVLERRYVLAAPDEQEQRPLSDRQDNDSDRHNRDDG